MPKPTTNFTGLSVNGNDANSTNGLYVPKLTTAQRDAINISNQQKLGGIIYNITTNRFEIFNSNGWTPITGGAGNGDVVGPNASTAGAVSLFADETGKVLSDSGLDVRNVLIQEEAQRTVGGLELSGLTYLKFSSDSSAIYVDALTGIQFITNDFGSDSQVCSLLTSGLPSSSTSPNALLELQSTSGAFLMSRMTSSQRDALIASNGMILYNTDTNQIQAYVNGAWTPLAGGGSGGGDVSGPNASITNDIPVFSDTSGKLIADSGVSITQVSQNSATVTQLNGLDSLNFNNNSNILASNIGGIQLLVNNFEYGQQICTLLTGFGLFSSTSPNALLEIQSEYGAFLMSRMNTNQRNALTPATGMMLYNVQNARPEIYTKGAWTGVNTSPADVVGPSKELPNNIANSLAIFTDSSGNVISDCGVFISQVQQDSTNVNELSGLGQLTFSGAGGIYVDALTGIQFITNDFGSDSQVCSLLTSGLPSSSTSPNALLELQSTSGAFLMSRMTSSQRDALTPADGMMLYNTDTNSIEAHTNGAWGEIAGNGDVIGPSSAVSSNIAIFADSSGKVIADSNLTLSVNQDNIGFSTSEANNTGNISLGYGSLGYVQASTSNVAIGILAYHGGSQDNPNQGTGSGNVAISSFALYQNVTGENNVAISSGALFNNDSGSNNICIGLDSGNSNNGSNNIMLGKNCGYYSLGDQNCIYIGALAQSGNNNFNLVNSVAIGTGAQVLVNNAMTLGKGLRVGIGNSSASYALDIGKENTIVPLIRLAATTSVPTAPDNPNDGLYFNNNGQSSYKSQNAIYSGNLITANSSDSSNASSGIATLNGLSGVLITTNAINSSSVVISTHYKSTLSASDPIGTIVITNIVNGSSFTISSTNAGDNSQAFWQIINPT